MELILTGNWKVKISATYQPQSTIINLYQPRRVSGPQKKPPPAEAGRGHPKNQILGLLKSVFGYRTFYYDEWWGAPIHLHASL